MFALKGVKLFMGALCSCRKKVAGCFRVFALRHRSEAGAEHPEDACKRDAEGEPVQQEEVLLPGQYSIDPVHAHKKVMVRLETDLDDPCHPEPVTEQILLPAPFLVSTYQKPDLFAGKMHAVLFRSWRSRVKGRDWFDMVWYLGQEVPLRIEYLEKKMKQSGKLDEGASLTPDLFRSIMLKSVEELISAGLSMMSSLFLRKKMSNL